MNPHEEENLEITVQTQLDVNITDYLIIDKPLTQHEEDVQVATRIEEIIKIIEKALTQNGITSEIN